jgi:hypothetical protein
MFSLKISAATIIYLLEVPLQFLFSLLYNRRTIMYVLYISLAVVLDTPFISRVATFVKFLLDNFYFYSCSSM